MKEKPQTRDSDRLTDSGNLSLTTLIFFAPVAAICGRLILFLRTLGWKFTLVFISVLGNVAFVFAIILALMIDDKDATQTSLPRQDSSVSNQVNLPAGLLRLARIPTDEATDGVLPDSIVVMLGDCAIATFAFDATYSRLLDSQLYDAQCRPCLSLELDSGATFYSFYQEGADPEYTISDKNADGIGDRKIDWVSMKSYIRVGEPIWKDVTRHKPSKSN